jgi:hypothetical protein
MALPFDPPEVDPSQMTMGPSIVPPTTPVKRTGPFNLEFSPCVMCDAYRPCEQPAAHGWGFCSIHCDFMRGNGCCGQWQAKASP